MKLHLLMHIPKTGGQTIRDHLRAYLTLHEEFVHLGPFGDADARANGLTPWKERSDPERARVRVLAGHDISINAPKLVPGERTTRFAGIFRDPVSRMVSQYNFMAYQFYARKALVPPPWAIWYKTKGRNYVTRWIQQKFLDRSIDDSQRDEDAYDEIVAALDHFWLLGVMNHFDAFVRQVYADIGVPQPSQERSNIGGRDYPILVTVNEKIDAQIRRDHPVDCAVYDLVERRVEAALQPASVQPN